MTTAPAVPTQRQQGRFESFIPTYLLKEQLSFAVLVWLGFVAFVFVAILAYASWREVERSGWDMAAQIPQWYALFIGVYVGWSVLPLHLTHGQTRREFMAQAISFTFIFAALISVLVTVTYVAEAGLYQIAGWPQDVQDRQLYTGPLQLHLVLLQSLMLVTLWTAGGVFVAAAWYRSELLGGAALVGAIVFAGISGAVLEPSAGPFGAVAERLSNLAELPLPAVAAVHLALVVVIGALTWAVVRDVAVRPKSA